MKRVTEIPTHKEKSRIRSVETFIFILVIIVITVFGFLHMYNRYNDEVLYSERLSQMKEVTTQLFAGIEDVAKSCWKNAEMQSNYVMEEQPSDIENLQNFMTKQEKLGSMDAEKTSLIAVDSEGLYYTKTGQKGLLAEQRYLVSKPERVSFVTTGLFGNETRMVFLMQLSTPVTIINDNKEVQITYYGITQSMTELKPYFSCEAYGGNNDMYVTDEQGLKIFDGSENNMIKGYNIFSVLSNMEYLHGSSFEQTRKELSDTGTAYSNTVLDGNEYYYALYRMDNAEWIMLFMVPSRFVAMNTVELVNASVRIILSFAVVMICICAALIFIMMRRQQKSAVLLERKNSERLEVLNGKLQNAVEEAERSEQKAKDASKAKSDFLSNMSHDIRTPMNAIVGITNLMKHDENNPEKLDAYINKLQTSSRHLLGLINDVLDMSKIESSEITLNVETINLAEQISQIANIIRAQTEEKQQSFIIRVHEIEHEFLIGDGVRIRQILINLLSNAVKYTQAGGAISLDLTELPDSVSGNATFSIVVTDNGCGMTPKFLEHIFEPFVRAENSTTNKVQGTGLGMTITKKIVDLMNGTIEVQSESGNGSRFEVIISLEINEDVEYELPVKDILLICDEAVMIENIRASLKKSGVVLQAVQTLEEAENFMQKESVDVVLLGNCIKEPTLPDMVHMLRAQAENKILIFCCDDVNPEKVCDLLHDSGADGLIQRPFFLSNFVKAINAANESKEPDQTGESNPLQGKRFLCAEDNELNAEILTAVLEMEGAEYTVYRNGKEIVDAFLHVKPGEYDAILMDVQMPVMNGLEATRQIRVSDNPLGRTIPIIAMTANAFSSDVQACLDAGMNAHVSKPLDIKVLARTIKSLQTDMFFGGGTTVRT